MLLRNSVFLGLVFFVLTLSQEGLAQSETTANKTKELTTEENFIKNISNLFPTKNIILSNTIAKNPLLIAGLMIRKIKIKVLYLAFFDGNPKNEQETIIMNETLESLKKLSKNSIKFFSITENFFNIPYENPWLND